MNKKNTKRLDKVLTKIAASSEGYVSKHTAVSCGDQCTIAIVAGSKEEADRIIIKYANLLRMDKL